MTITWCYVDQVEGATVGLKPREAFRKNTQGFLMRFKEY